MPPPPPPKGPAQPSKPSDSDSTVLAPRPEMTDETGALDDGIVWSSEEEDDTNRTVVGKEKPRLPEVSSSDISLIEAKESVESPRIASFGEGAIVEDFPHPSTEVLRLAFSEADQEPEPEEPVELKKWKMGLPKAAAAEGDTNETADASDSSLASGFGATPISTPAPSGVSPAPTPSHGTGGRDASRGRGAVFSAPASEQGAHGGGTRVDVGAAAGRPMSLDVDELRRNLEEAERLLKTVKQQLSGVDLEARGTNAQLAAALHRLGEALAMLRR